MKSAKEILYTMLLSKLVHYSEEVGKAEKSNDETLRTVMASKQQAILEVLMEMPL